MKTKAWVTTKKGNQFEVLLPAKRAVCPACDGCGTQLYGGLKGAVFTASDFEQDPDFHSSYFGGDYDTVCEACEGKNVVLVVDLDKLSSKMKDRLFRAECEREKAELEHYYEQRFLSRGWS